jgi:hypothetical protein
MEPQVITTKKEDDGTLTIHSGADEVYWIPADRMAEDWLTHLARKTWATRGMIEDLHALGAGGDLLHALHLLALRPRPLTTADAWDVVDTGQTMGRPPSPAGPSGPAAPSGSASASTAGEGRASAPSTTRSK